MAIFFGFNFPFLSKVDVLPPQSDVRLIKNDLLQLLLTLPGERVMNSQFGTPIRAFTFEPFDQESFNVLKEHIARAISVFEPRVILRDIQITGDSGRSHIDLSVITSLTRDPNIILAVELSVANPLNSSTNQNPVQ